MHVELFPGTVLRDAGLLDVERLINLENSIDDVVGLNKWGIARWVYEIEKNTVWVIEQGGMLVYVVGFIHDQEKQEIDVIKLTAGPVGRSLTGRLIQAGAQLLKEKNVEKIKGRCSELMIDFYERLGFQVTGELPHYFGVGINGFAIERVL